MSVVPFDTHKFVKRLREAVFTAPQTEAVNAGIVAMGDKAGNADPPPLKGGKVPKASIPILPGVCTVVINPREDEAAKP